MNVLKEIKVTESCLGLSEKDRECQNREDLEDCTTRLYEAAFLDQCECKPLSIRTSQNVYQKNVLNIHQPDFVLYFRSLCVVQKSLPVLKISK